MALIFFILTFIFLLIGFTSNLPALTDNPFLNYALSELHLYANYYTYFDLGILFVTIIFFVILKTPHGYSKLQKMFVAFGYTITISFISCFAAFVLLVCIAFVELNVFAVLITINPSLTGLVADQKSIIKSLKTTTEYPTVIATNNDQKKILLAVAIATAGKTSLFGNSILPAIPSSILLPVKQSKSSILLLDNTIIVTAISSKDLSVISPYIGYLFVKHYFIDRNIKSYPKVAILEKNRYTAFRETDVAAKLKQIDKELALLQDATSSVSAAIQKDKDLIAADQNEMKNTYNTRDKEYRTCLIQKIKTECQSVMDTWQDSLDKIDTEITVTTQKLTKDQAQQTLYSYYTPFLTSQKTVVAASRGNIPHELGVFTPKNTIEIMLFTTDPHAIADYFETVAHEYLHYASYVSEDKHFTSSFFEEGLTEYFARQTIQNTLDTSTNLGYPVFVKIIDQMAKRISEPDLADIYFSKDQQLLEKTINTAYGDNFYANNQILFATLQYASTPKDQLKIANEIMKRLGGAPLTEKDIQSTSSNLN